MRIVQLANFYGPRSGGLRTALHHLGAGYVRAGHEVVLVVPGPEHSEEVLDSGVTRISLPAMQIPFTGGYRLANPRAVADVLGGLRPDSIEVSDRLTLRGFGNWARARDVASVMISHERLDRLASTIMPREAARRFADFANRRTAEQYDRVVCTTEFARQEFSRIGVDNVHLVPLGVDLAQFDPSRKNDELRSELGQGAQSLLVHCGRLSVEKRVDRSIEAIRVMRNEGVDARLVVAGDGPRRNYLEKLAKGLPVHFTGFISDRDRLASLLATADASIAPGPHETFGLAALEALASGTPVIVSRSSALADIVTSDCGAAADNTPDAIAAGISNVLQMPDPVRRAAARRRAEQFDWPTSVNGMLAALAR